MSATTTSTKCKMQEILETALGVTLEGVENPSRDELEGWDSLSHIEVVFMVEEEWGIHFSETEIAALRSLDDLVQAVSAKHAA
jgi:acyl carrier protein